MDDDIRTRIADACHDLRRLVADAQDRGDTDAAALIAQALLLLARARAGVA